MLQPEARHSTFSAVLESTKGVIIIYDREGGGEMKGNAGRPFLSPLPPPAPRPGVSLLIIHRLGKCTLNFSINKSHINDLIKGVVINCQQGGGVAKILRPPIRGHNFFVTPFSDPTPLLTYTHDID